MTPAPDDRPVEPEKIPKTPSTTELEPATSPLKALAARLAQGAVIITALLTLLGIKEGQLDRLLRNEPTQALVFAGLAGIGIVLGIGVLAFERISRRSVRIIIVLLIVVLGSIFVVLTSEDEEWAGEVGIVSAVAVGLLLIFVAGKLPGRGVLLLAGSVAFLVGVAGIAKVSVDSKKAKDRPKIEASISESNGRWNLSGRVTARGLTSREHILVVVEGTNFDVPLEERRVGRESDPVAAKDALEGKPAGNDFFQTIALMRVGPDSNGEVSLPLTVPVTAGLYDRLRVAVRLETEASNATREEEEALRDRLDAARDELPQGEESSPKVVEAQNALDEFFRKHREIWDDDRCSSEIRERSCSYVALPQSIVRPTIALNPSSPPGSMSLHVVAAGINPDDVVDIQLIGEQSILYRARLSADSSGLLDHTVAIPTDPSSLKFCALGRIVRGAGLAAADSQQQAFPSSCPDEPAWDVASAEVLLPSST